MESLSEQGLITLYYADESHVCSEVYVPHGWQFPNEGVSVGSQKGFRLNCWAMISRQNQCLWQGTEQTIDSQFILNQFDMLSFSIHQPTYIVLDNARIQPAKIIQKRVPFWQKRGLYLFFYHFILHI